MRGVGVRVGVGLAKGVAGRGVEVGSGVWTGAVVLSTGEGLILRTDGSGVGVTRRPQLANNHVTANHQANFLTKGSLLESGCDRIIPRPLSGKKSVIMSKKEGGALLFGLLDVSYS
jgi:hypothetical protein